MKKLVIVKGKSDELGCCFRYIQIQSNLVIFVFHGQFFFTRRKRRKLFAMKKQARERMQVGGGATADSEDVELFSLNNIKSKKVK